MIDVSISDLSEYLVHNPLQVSTLCILFSCLGFTNLPGLSLREHDVFHFIFDMVFIQLGVSVQRLTQITNSYFFKIYSGII